MNSKTINAKQKGDDDNEDPTNFAVVAPGQQATATTMRTVQQVEDYADMILELTEGSSTFIATAAQGENGENPRFLAERIMGENATATTLEKKELAEPVNQATSCQGAELFDNLPVKGNADDYTDVILDLTEGSSAFMAVDQGSEDQTQQPLGDKVVIDEEAKGGGSLPKAFLERREAARYSSRPGAYAAAPSSNLVSRESPNLQTLNDQLAGQRMDGQGEEQPSPRQPGPADGLVETNNMVAREGPLEEVAVVEAFKVEIATDDHNNNKYTDNENLENELRQKIIKEAVPADVIHMDKKKGCKKVYALVAAVVVLIVGVTVGFLARDTDGSQDQLPPTQAPENTTLPASGITFTTLQDVLDRGVLKCGVYVVGLDVSDINIRFTLEPCRAISAAIFDGNGDNYETVARSGGTYHGLEAGEYDVLAQMSSITMDRDINGEGMTSEQGLDFTYPLYFNGVVFRGVAEFVECAERLDPFNGICRNMRVCVAKDSSGERFVQGTLLSSVAVQFENIAQAISLMSSGECNVAATEAATLNIDAVEELAPILGDLNFTIGSKVFSNEAGCLATVDGSTDMSDMVNSVMKILYTAEAMNLTRDNVATFPFSEDLNAELKARIVNVVSVVGNYADVYDKSNTGENGRNLFNTLNHPVDDDSGLMFAYPFGLVDQFPTTSSATMEEIQRRGHLRCGIVEKPLFAEYDGDTDEYSGFFVEYCHALAAALFVGDTTKVEFTLLNDKEAYSALADGTVDVLSGQRASLTNEFFEPPTGLSYSFSSPIFYGNNGSIWVLVSRRTDALWSSFVFWVTMALVFAEQESISFRNALELPAVNLFGVPYIQSFRDCVSQVGNYGDIYNRTLEPVIPRAGRNKLNVAPFGPQQVAYPLM